METAFRQIIMIAIGSDSSIEDSAAVCAASSDHWQQQRAWVEIDRNALAHNVRQIASLLEPGTEIIAVVKANAYGHGAIEVAKTVLANGATWLAVATVPEGMDLRRSGIEAPILLLGAASSADQIVAIEKWRLQPTIVSSEQAACFQEFLSGPIDVHLKLDTGMSRLGTNYNQSREFCRSVQSCSKLRIASIYSHLATADEPDDRVWAQQRCFAEAIAAVKPLFDVMPKLHLANSAGTLLDRSLHYDLVRPGLALYGLSPAPHLASRLDLRPALAVYAKLTQVKDIAAGTGVSYSHRFVAPHPMKIAVLGIGYADGVPRSLSQQMEVILHGVTVPQIGNITMDQIILDVTAVPMAQVGDVVTLLGRVGQTQITADDWASKIGTISWEILCGFNHRLPRLLG
jgi:alanine racemase